MERTQRAARRGAGRRATVINTKHKPSAEQHIGTATLTPIVAA